MNKFALTALAITLGACSMMPDFLVSEAPTPFEIPQDISPVMMIIASSDHGDKVFTGMPSDICQTNGDAMLNNGMADQIICQGETEKYSRTAERETWIHKVLLGRSWVEQMVI